jgi:predicted transcriptional regulator
MDVKHVNDENKLLGIITKIDLLSALIDLVL